MNSKAIFMFLFLLIVIATPTSVSAQNPDTLLMNDNLTRHGTYNDIYVIFVEASYPDGIWFVTLNIEGDNVQSVVGDVDNLPPYLSLTYPWDTTLIPDGAYHIEIRWGVNTSFSLDKGYDVFVNNTVTGLSIETKIQIIYGSGAVIFTVMTFAFFKSDLAETRKQKGVVVILGVLVFSVIAVFFWMVL